MIHLGWSKINVESFLYIYFIISDYFVNNINGDQMYYNYHGIIKNKIKNNELIKIEFVDEYHKIKNVMLLYFSDGSIKPIREHRWFEYHILINNYYNKIKK